MALSLTEEQALVERARDDDRVAFGILVSHYVAALERILLPIASGRVDRARDWCQDAILRAWRGLPGFRKGHRFSSWFFRIGVNLALTAKRREGLDEASQPVLAAGVRESEDPAERVAFHEDRERLRAAMTTLPERYRAVLVARYFDGRSCAEIARDMNTTPNAVSIALFRAKERLRGVLEKTP